VFKSRRRRDHVEVTNMCATSIVPCLWFNALVVGWNTTESELNATDATVPLARSLGELLFCLQLKQSMLPEL
jgi:hypothetical protein